MIPDHLKKQVDRAKKKLDKFLLEYEETKKQWDENCPLLDMSDGTITFYGISNVRIEDEWLMFYDSSLKNEVKELIVSNDWYEWKDEKPRNYWYNNEVEEWIKEWKMQLKAYKKYMNEVGENEEKWLKENL